MPKLIVSIVTWNSASTISACVKSVLNQSFSDFQLIIVDNNSKDQTCELIESFKDERIRLIRNSENTGFCGGHNLSIKSLPSEFVLLVNPDIIMSSDYIEKSLQVADKNVNIGTVCGLLLQSEDTENLETLIDSAGLDIKPSRVMRMRYHGLKRKECDLTECEVFGADGALPLYRRAMIDDISFEGEFFDEMFFAHKEDWDVSWRSTIYGWKAVFTPHCVAVHPRHFKPKSLMVRSNISSGIKVHSVKNQIILLLKNESLGSLLLNLIFIIPRQLVIFAFILLLERTSLRAYLYIYKNYSTIIKKRNVIQGKKKKIK